MHVHQLHALALFSQAYFPRDRPSAVYFVATTVLTFQLSGNAEVMSVTFLFSVIISNGWHQTQGKTVIIEVASRAIVHLVISFILKMRSSSFCFLAEDTKLRVVFLLLHHHPLFTLSGNLMTRDRGFSRAVCDVYNGRVFSLFWGGGSWNLKQTFCTSIHYSVLGMIKDLLQLKHLALSGIFWANF